VISIIREVIGDVPLKIYENATCKKLSIPELEEGGWIEIMVSENAEESAPDLNSEHVVLKYDIK